MSDKLNPRQKAFIKEYCVDKNGTRAAMRAGYSGNERVLQVHASRLMSNAIIKSAIDSALEKQHAEIDTRVQAATTAKVMTKAMWLDEVTAIATATPSDLLTLNDKGKLTVSMVEIKKNRLDRAARKLKIFPNGTAEFELHPKLQALELLAKHHGWVSDKLQFAGEASPSDEITHDDLKSVFSSPENAAAALILAKATSKVKTKGEQE
jgi:hypothetical protein